MTENGTSGYTSTQEEDLVSCTHRAFRPIDVKMGPDGAIYIADWYNPIIQHGEVDFRDERRDHKHGRIWRISFPGRPLDKRFDFENASEEDLAHLAGPVGWNSQMATVELRNRDPEKALAGIRSAWQQNQVKAQSRLPDAYLVMASQAINRFQKEWALDLAQTASAPQVRAAALRSLYYEAANIGEAKSIATRAISDSHPRVRLWGVSVLAQLDDADTVQVALNALKGIENPDPFLDFAVWSICREHSSKWMAAAEKGNPFSTARQLLYAARAVNSMVGSGPIFDAFKKGDLRSEREIAELSDWVARTGRPLHLDLLWNTALDANTPDHQKATILDGLLNASKLRKMKPGGKLNSVQTFLDSKNSRLFGLAANLAGEWKVAEARSTLESAFLGSDPGRSNAALEGLRSFGGAETGNFLTKLAQNKEAPLSQRARAITGLSRFNPAGAARFAAGVLPTFDDPKAAEGIFAAFLSNNKSTIHLTNALNGKGVTLPEPIALVGVQKASSAATRPEALIKAIQKAGNLKPMKMALTPEEMNSMMKTVAEKGDPHRGESVYRRFTLQCTVCHAIGGSGGVVGPDLVSIGASAPVDYLIESLLEPSKKIKEGYHTTLVTLKNGDTYAGAVGSDSSSELMIRDAAGNENRIAKNQVANQTISPVSLMPPGLTLQLREDEFIDLVRFMSELGKEGEFKTGATPYVRNWQVLQPHERTRDDIGHYGKKIFAEEFKTYQWTPFYARVDGSLPLSEMPDMVGRGRNRYGVARFKVTVAQANGLKLRIEGKSKDLNLFLDDAEIAIPGEQGNSEVTIPLKPGDHRITLVGLKGWGLDKVRVEILGSEGITLK